MFVYKYTQTMEYVKNKVLGKIRPFVNLGIGIGIGTGTGTDITNVIISSSIRPMDPKLSRVVT